MSIEDLNNEPSELTSTSIKDTKAPSLLSSLLEMTSASIPIALAPPSREKKISVSLIVRGLLLLLCLCILLYTLSTLLVQLRSGFLSQDTYSDLSNQFWYDGEIGLSPLRPDHAIIASPDYDASQSMNDFSDFLEKPTYNEQFEKIKARLNALKATNPETYGYIYIEDTQVDYPLVQHSDNDYYLKHDFTGKYSGTGSIFVDYRNISPVQDNRNLVLFGHHMSSGSTMFHTLDYFFDKSFFDSHPDIYIYTTDGIYQFRVFAVYKTTMHFPYIRTDFSTDQDFIDFCENMRSQSLYKRDGVVFDANSTLLTLSTCTNIVKSDRIAVQAVLVNIEK